MSRRIAVITTDNREHQRTYSESVPRFGPAVEAVLDGLAQISELELHVISCTQRPMAAPEKLADNTWFHLLHVPKIGWLRTGYQGCVRAIKAKLREIKPDLVHGQGTERECAISAALSGFPNVVTIHGNVGEVAAAMGARVGSYFWCMARVESLRSAERTGGVLTRNSAHAERPAVCPSVPGGNHSRTCGGANALRPAFFTTPIPAGPRMGKPILLNVGVVTPFKRQLELLSVAEDLQRQGTELEWQFIGMANPRLPYAEKFLTRVAAAERLGFARHLQPMSLDDIVALFDSATALVHAPSEEAFGLVVAEALARNLKFFGSRTGGVPDIAEGVEGAELFAPGDDEASGMGVAVERWLEDRSTQPVNSAAATMRARYHPDVVAKEHMVIYREFLGRS